PAGTYTLTLPRIGNDFFNPNPAGGALDIGDDLTIAGAGAATTIIQGGATLASAVDRVFNVGFLQYPAPNSARISGVTITNGSGRGAEGCFGGGGILNYYSASVALSDVVITANNAGLCAYGSLTIDRSTISNNHTAGFGGGISAIGSTPIRNSTIRGNSVVNGPFGGSAFGGGI